MRIRARKIRHLEKKYCFWFYFPQPHRHLKLLLFFCLISYSPADIWKNQNACSRWKNKNAYLRSKNQTFGKQILFLVLLSITASSIRFELYHYNCYICQHALKRQIYPYGQLHFSSFPAGCAQSKIQSVNKIQSGKIVGALTRGLFIPMDNYVLAVFPQGTRIFNTNFRSADARMIYPYGQLHFLRFPAKYVHLLLKCRVKPQGGARVKPQGRARVKEHSGGSQG